MIGLRSLLFNVLFYAWSGLVQVACLPVLALPREGPIAAGRLWSRVTLAMLAGICGLRHEIRGLANLPEGPCIIASKHQSAWDTLIFHLLVPGPSFVFKRELMWVPLFGWYLMRAGCIPVDRAGGAKALRALVDRARRAVAHGQSIVIFPEGTRVAPGRRRPYHPGTAALYVQLGVPVVPVAVNSGLFWGRRSFRKEPGRITLEFLPPIPPGLPRRAFAAELERRIETASQRLLAASAPAAAGDARHACG
ncbi:MAG: lysophospholipid acyltransferase family protein [Kiloniellaceae bacterium]